MHFYSRFFTLFLGFSIALCNFLTGNDITLKQTLSLAEAGNYLVLEQNKTFTFFHIYEKKDNRILIEEVSIPESHFDRNISWKNWFEMGGPHHTSWTMALINLETGNFEEMYSFTQSGWIDISHTDTFLTTLLNLNFEEVPENLRRHVGLPPKTGKMDLRPLWHPRLIVDSQWIPNVYFFVWKTRWPADGTELSRKNIEIYLPEMRRDASTPDYPVFFPYLVEVEGKIGSAKLRVVDSGAYARSPKIKLPLRPPQLSGTPQLTSEGLFITLKSPLYFNEFLLFAEATNADPFFDKPVALNSDSFRDKDTVILTVDRQILNQNLKNDTSYRLIIAPKDDPYFCIELKNPIALN